MSKAVANTVALVLSLVTVGFWLAGRGPSDADEAGVSMGPLATENAPNAKAATSYCIRRTDKHDIEVEIRAHCNPEGDAKPMDTLGHSIEARRDPVIVTGYDL